MRCRGCSGSDVAESGATPEVLVAAVVTHTEASMLALLERRYRGDMRGNGPAWAFVPKVKNAAGFNATRTIDALAMSLWPSRGLELHGHEIKVSRADWLRELKDPAKAEAFTQLVDRWWLVVSDAKIVQDGELPPTWGLMVATGRGLVVKVQAPELPPTDSPWMPKTFLAALLRSATRTHEVTPAEVEAAVTAAQEAWESQHAENIERWREDRDGLRARLRAFEEASGLTLGSWRVGLGDAESAARVGAAVRLVLEGEAKIEQFQHRLLNLAEQADRLAGELRVAAGAPDNVTELVA